MVIPLKSATSYLEAIHCLVWCFSKGGMHVVTSVYILLYQRHGSMYLYDNEDHITTKSNHISAQVSWPPNAHLFGWEEGADFINHYVGYSLVRCSDTILGAHYFVDTQGFSQTASRDGTLVFMQ